jgi:hypothetical protein
MSDQDVSALAAISACFLLVFPICCAAQTIAQPSPFHEKISTREDYLWLRSYDLRQAVLYRIQCPEGYERLPYPDNSFGYWMEHLPLKPGLPPVHLYNGSLKSNQTAHYAVIDIDTSDKDLQQCADAVIRLRAEYLYNHSRYSAMAFAFTNGQIARFTKWIEGFRPVIQGGRVRWLRKAVADSSYASMREFLETVFTYAGTLSLQKQLRRLPEIQDLCIGDVFIQGGSPGHAVIVADVAVSHSDGQKIFILAQSFMPAQEMHILRNPGDESMSPWYAVMSGPSLRTPEWTFGWSDLYRFEDDQE